MEKLVLWHRALPRTRLGTEDTPAPVRWTTQVTHHMEERGGECLGVVGAAVIFAFEPHAYEAALEAALELLDRSDHAPASAGIPAISFGVDLGEVDRSTDTGTGVVAPSGAVIDRAQLLANAARPGELALSSDAQDLASARYLFSRVIEAGGGTVTGQAVDRGQPRRNTARRCIAHLARPPIARGTLRALAPFAELAAGDGSELVVLRGPSTAGAREYLARLAEEIDPPLVLQVGGVPGALEPLGSLRLALLRAWGDPDSVRRELAGLEPEALEDLAAIAGGEPREAAVAVGAMAALVRWVGRIGGRPWILLDPVPAIDAATLRLLGKLRLDPGAELLVVARLAHGSHLPEALGSAPRSRQWIVPPLTVEDAQELAGAVLHAPANGDLARRVALFGGSTPLGIAEAAHTLVAAGDLVPDGEGFRWRLGPRAGHAAIPTEALLEERLTMLEDGPYRMLEAVCAAPPGSPAELCDVVAAMDGLEPSVRTSSLATLEAERLVAFEPAPVASSPLLRALVLRSMPPARGAELYRFLAHAIGRSASHQGAFVKATLGYFLAEGGNPAAGARALLEAGVAAARRGHSRAAVRLAAAAVQYHPSAETRTAAARISRSVSTIEDVRPTAPAAGRAQATAPVGSNEAVLGEDTEQGRVSALAVRALLEGDLEAVDRQIETAIAEGRDLAAADRLRAMTHLARGDTAAAMRALGRARAQAEGDHRKVARASLTLAWIQLHEGDVHHAVCAAMQALAASRRLRDARGEAAAMHTLSACYRAVGREAEAEAVADASPL